MNTRVYNALRKVASDYSRQNAGIGNHPKVTIADNGQVSVDVSNNPYLKSLAQYGIANGLDMQPFTSALKHVFTRVKPTATTEPITNFQRDYIRAVQAGNAIPVEWKWDPSMHNTAVRVYNYLKSNGAHHEKLEKQNKLNSALPAQRELPIPEGLPAKAVEIIKKVGPTMARRYTNNQGTAIG